MTPLSVSVVGVAGFEPATSWSQTRRDDRATLHPEKKAERQGFEPWRRLPVDRLAICSVTTPAPLQMQLRASSRNADANLRLTLEYSKQKRLFFKNVKMAIRNCLITTDKRINN